MSRHTTMVDGRIDEKWNMVALHVIRRRHRPGPGTTCTAAAALLHAVANKHPAIINVVFNWPDIYNLHDAMQTCVGIGGPPHICHHAVTPLSRVHNNEKYCHTSLLFCCASETKTLTVTKLLDIRTFYSFDSE